MNDANDRVTPIYRRPDELHANSDWGNDDNQEVSVELNTSNQNEETPTDATIKITHNALAMWGIVFAITFSCFIIFLTLYLLEASNRTQGNLPQCKAPDGFVHSWEELQKTLDSFTCPKALDMIQAMYFDKVSKCFEKTILSHEGRGVKTY